MAEETRRKEYEAKTVLQLGPLLEERGLPKTGKKANLIERLLKYDAAAEAQVAPEAVEPKVVEVAEPESQPCVNHKRCGNQAKPPHRWCDSCHLEYGRRRVDEEDQITRPLRGDIKEQLKRAGERFARYYRSEKPTQWPQEVRRAFMAAKGALAEGDRLALEALASRKGDPNPGLFKVVRAYYFMVRNHLSTAGYHSARISLRGVLKGVPRYAQREVAVAVEKAEKSFAVTEGLKGRKLTEKFGEASYLMRQALKLAREERDRLKKLDAGEFYGGQPIGNLIPEKQVEALQSVAPNTPKSDPPRDRQRGEGETGRDRQSAKPYQRPSSGEMRRIVDKQLAEAEE